MRTRKTLPAVPYIADTQASHWPATHPPMSLMHFNIQSESVNNKFWYKLMAYFPCIQHGPHRKRGLQQFFIAVGTCLLGHCLAMTGGYTARPTDSHLIQHRPYRKGRLQQFFIAVGTCLLGRCLAMTGGYTARPTDTHLIQHGPYRK
jgi:hypothetical protein